MRWVTRALLLAWWLGVPGTFGTASAQEQQDQQGQPDLPDAGAEPGEARQTQPPPMRPLIPPPAPTPVDAGAPAPMDAGPALGDDAGIDRDAEPEPSDAGAAMSLPPPDASEPNAGPSDAPAAPPTPEPATEPSIVPVPVPAMDPGLFEGLLPGLPDGGPWTALGIVALLAGAFLLSRLIRRLRESLPDTGAIPWVVDLLQTVVRLSMLLLLVGLVARLLPESLSPALSWALLAAAAAVGWSTRDVLVDLVAGVVLAFERRIRRGVWLSVEGHAGIVETRGLRAVWLRDVLGHRIALPNRMLLGGAVVSEPGGAVHDVSLRLAVPGCPTTRLRQALHDAVLTSPWAQPEAGSIVRRDGEDPAIWHVRARLIDVRFAMRFEGDLLERAEEILQAEIERARAAEEEDWD